MVYFLGRDVDVYIAAEDTNAIYVATGATSAPTTTAGSNTLFAGARTAGTGGTAVANLTGCDLSIGAIDEDITYFGFRSVTKAEIKKETTLSLTRKKVDDTWEAIFEGARYGVSGTAAGNFTANALKEPTIVTGYRIQVVLKDSEEIFAIMGACIQSHSVSINADGITEETLEFMSYISPNIGNAQYTDVLTVAEL